MTIMGVTFEEKAELVAYQLKVVAQIWYEQQKETKVINAPVTWDEFKLVFLDHFFPLKLCEVKMREFMNLKQGSMTVREYSLKFTKLSRYVCTLVANPRAKMSQFMSGLNDTLVNACCAAMMIKEMDIARLMTHMKEIEGQNMKEQRMIEFKRAQHEGNFSKVEEVVERNHKGKGPMFQIKGLTKTRARWYTLFLNALSMEEITRANVWLVQMLATSVARPVNFLETVEVKISLLKAKRP